jgi:lipoprotein-anchoring transpeptidase ErfK/SrfK
MMAPRHVWLAALATACILAAPASPRAQAVNPHPAQTLPLLPAMRARPPASRIAAASARPARAPVVRRAALQPALAPVTPLDETKVAPNGETAAQITREAVNGGREAFPVGPGLRGPSVLRVQVLLDRVLFSPGMIDGSWGRNTSIAVYWFQARERLVPTGVVDSATFARLHLVAGRPAEYVARRTLTAADVRGPFIEMPSSIYAQAELECSCYESLAEKLSELFHVRVELLRQLNPGVALNALKAGDALNVPNVRDADAAPRGVVETLVVSGADHYLQALDAAGRILYQFPTTVGSSYDPSPEGSFHVLQVTENPWWHYQPSIIKGRNPNAPEAHVPPGPNNSVGKVWMTLSTEHYGIHGTKSPETIGYAVSAGCVRLANWDALYLARRITPGTPVVFRGTRTRAAMPSVNRTPAPPAAPRRPAVAGARADSTRAKPAVDSTRRDSTRRDSAAPTPVRSDSAAPPAPQAQPAPAPAAPPTPPPAAPPAPAQPDSAARPSRRPQIVSRRDAEAAEEHGASLGFLRLPYSNRGGLLTCAVIWLKLFAPSNAPRRSCVAGQPTPCRQKSSSRSLVGRARLGSRAASSVRPSASRSGLARRETSPWSPSAQSTAT